MKFSSLLASVLMIFSYIQFSAICENININMKYNTLSPDSENYVKWSDKNNSYKDYFDTVSGASKSHNVKTINSLYRDNSKEQLIPSGLRALLLFPTSPDIYRTRDNFTAVNQNGVITIQFIHRSTAYKIITDEKGFADINKSFFIAKDIAENQDGVFRVKNDYISEENSSFPDWNKISLENDIPSEKTMYIINGKLKISVNNKGIMTVRGSLTKSEKEKNKETD